MFCQKEEQCQVLRKGVVVAKPLLDTKEGYNYYTRPREADRGSSKEAEG